MTGTRVLFIGGVGRSGSTLVDRMLGQVSGVFSIGELVHIWSRGLQRDELCGCGESFSACPFWSEVGREAFGGWDRLDPHGLETLQRSVDRNRHVPRLLMPGAGGGAYAKKLGRYADTLARIYRAVAAVSGAGVIVDSSKHASTAALLRRVPGIDLRLAHLVRDPRGVAYSWGKVVEKPEVTGGGEFMARVGPSRIAARWVSYNAIFDVLRVGRPSILLKYESLVEDPPGELGRLIALAGLPSVDMGFLRGTGVELAPNHTVAGNPLRFKTGSLQIRRDEEWRLAMPARDRRLVTMLTAPALLRYGYAGKSSS